MPINRRHYHFAQHDMASIMVKLPLCILAIAGSALGLAVPTKGKVEIRKEW